MRKSKSALGASLVVLSSLLYGSFGIWMKLMGSAFGSYEQAFIRCFVVSLGLLAYMTWRKKWERLGLRQNGKWLLLACLGSMFTAGPIYFATLKLGVGLATCLMYSGVVLGMFVFGWLFSGERYTKEKALATALAIAGLFFMFSGTFSHVGTVAFAAALGSGFGIALNVVAAQKMPYGATQSSAVGWFAGACANGLLMLVAGEQLRFVWSAAWVYLAIFSVIAVAAFWCVVRGVKLIDAGSAGILGLLEAVFGVVFGVIIFGERPTPRVLAGMAAIVCAAAIPYLHHFRLKDKPFELS